MCVRERAAPIKYASARVHVRTPLVTLCGPIGEQTVQTQPVRIALLVYSLHSQHSELPLSSLSHSICKLHVILPGISPQKLSRMLRSVVEEVLQLHQFFVRSNFASLQCRKHFLSGDTHHLIKMAAPHQLKGLIWLFCPGFCLSGCTQLPLSCWWMSGLHKPWKEYTQIGDETSWNLHCAVLKHPKKLPFYTSVTSWEIMSAGFSTFQHSWI